MCEEKEKISYRGRIAPTPSGYLHRGHVETFKVAYQRAQERNGTVVFRNDDIDQNRSKKKFLQAAIEDLKGLGIEWDEGPDCGGKFGPYNQSERGKLYFDILAMLAQMGFIYPCSKSRKDVEKFELKSREGNEFLFPKKLRPSISKKSITQIDLTTNWRFWTEWGSQVSFLDERVGEMKFEIGRDFSDFLVWRKEGVASYELATVVDDHLMQISEVVRGEDLLISSARQCLLFEALGWYTPSFYHCKLLYGSDGKKLSKSTRTLPRLYTSDC